MIYEQMMEATEAIQARAPQKPLVGLILGSGLGDLATEIENAVALSYEEIPHFARSTVTGHAGQLLIGTLAGVPVVIMQGRFHLYEGYNATQITLPVRVMHQLGAQTLIVTNAAGGVNPEYKPGDVMLMSDHIFLPGMVGMSPLVGPNDERFGVRFPAVANAYNAELRALAREAAQDVPGLRLHEGVYTMVVGPQFESKAELRFLRLIGSDAVGMSTVPEAVIARHMEMRVLGMSLITNTATGAEQEEVDHVSVLEVANAARPKFATLARGILRRLALL
ncbi:purine nucleoside phosphorylase 1 [Ktedonobacter sp. SOSP1-85]|nr:purine-nucleoside phosphorylase [Ktedonobacter sp. SOSP1-85]GHO73740.1 purine nucleoside phosphorylase 1 [Ktedonobacter sp. SOSP1-85]